MTDFDRMRGMHDYYGQAEDYPLYDEDDEYVGTDEDFPTERELDIQFLDEMDGGEPVCILGHEFDAGLALKALDPIAYREAFLNWLDANYSQLYDVNGDETDYYKEEV